MKGLLHVVGSAKPHVLQAVHELYDITPASTEQTDMVFMNKLVVIGRCLNRDELFKSFKRCFTS